MNELIYERKKFELNKKYEISRLTRDGRVERKGNILPNSVVAKLIAHKKYYMVFDINGVKECFMYADPHVKIEEVK